MIGLTVAAIATLFGILLGLLAVEAYQDFSAVEDIVSKEAQTIAVLRRDFGGFPQPARDSLLKGLRDFAHEAIEAAHPPPDVPQNPHSNSSALDAMFSEIMNFQPKLKSEEVIQAEAFSRLNALLEQRRFLVAAGEGGIPTELWYIVCLNGLLLLSLICLFDMELHVHLVLCSIIALFIGSAVFIIAALDNPFNGGLTVSSAPIESVLAVMMK